MYGNHSESYIIGVSGKNFTKKIMIFGNTGIVVLGKAALYCKFHVLNER